MIQASLTYTDKRLNIRSGLFCLIFSFLSGLAHVYGQDFTETNFHVDHYTDENGLPQNSVKQLMQDKNGFLWMATEDGLVRFDGVSFFNFNKINIPLAGNRIHGFVPSLESYNLNNQDFTALTENMQYVRIRNDGTGVLDDQFLKRHIANSPFGNRSKQGIHIMRTLPAINKILPEHEPFLFPAGNKKYFVWHSERIEYFDQKNKVSTINGNFTEFFLINSHPYATLKNGQFMDLARGPDAKPVAISGDLLADKSFNLSDLNHVLFWNNISQKAFLYYNRNLYLLFDLTNDAHRLDTRLILKNFDLKEFNISTIHYDEKRNYLFLGSYTKGLFVLRKKEFLVKQHPVDGAVNAYYAQVPLSDKTILSAQGQIFGPETDYSESEISKEDNQESKFFLAKSGNSYIWKGVTQKLNKYDASGTLLLASFPFPVSIKALYADHWETLWIGGRKDSLFSINTKDSQAVPQLILYKRFGEISCMQRISDNVLMIGTKNGLFKFKIAEKQLTAVKGLEKVNVRSMYFSAGDLWITTYGDGIYLHAKGRLTKLPLDKNQYLATSHCIIEDKKGFFWITTNKGLFQVLKSDLIDFSLNSQVSVFYFYYDKRNGFNSNEFNGGCQPCGLMLKDQTISFPSMEGFVWFKPDSLKSDLPKAKIFISSVELDGKSAGPGILANIPMNFGQLRIRITTPYFNDKRNLYLWYSLHRAGERQVWLPITSSEKVILIPNTISGQYMLTVRKQDGFGKNNYSYKTWDIQIIAAWYENWLFQFFVAVLLLGVFWLILKTRTTYLLSQEKKKNLYRRYHISSQIVAAINHDIQTPLHYIADSISQIRAEVKEKFPGDAYISKLSEETVNTIKRTSAHTANLLNYIKSQNQNVGENIEFVEVDLSDLVFQTCQLLAGTAKFRDVSLHNEVSEPVLILSDAKLLSVIIHNLLDNAVKLSDTSVVIRAEIHDQKNVLIIEDTANGMPAEILEWLNKTYKSYEEWMRDYEYPDHRGLGLIIIKDLCILLNIKMEVVSKSGQGSLVKLIF